MSPCALVLVMQLSELFDFTGQDIDLKTVEYMKLLDTDKDSYIGFFDFLQPIIHVVPPEVITSFTQDERFKQEVFNDLRLAYDSVKTTVATPIGPQVQVDVNTLSAKLIEKGTEQGKHLSRIFNSLLALIKHQEGQPLNTTDFQIGVCRLEKRALFTFTSKLYQDEELRLRGLVTKTQPFVPDHKLHIAVATAVDDDNLQVSDAKNLLRQM